MLLFRMLSRLIRDGRLEVVDARGGVHAFGTGDAAETIIVRLTDPALHWKLAVNPGLYAGEAYMDGTLQMVRGSLYDFIDLVTRNAGFGHIGPFDGLRRLGIGLQRLWQQRNPLDRSRRNVAHHYDLSGALYDLFLDADRQYSCAYFAEPEMNLEEAQAAKKHHIAAKLLLRPGQKVLDIGCGWGGMALTLAELADVEVTGITLSREQLAVARQRAELAGLSDRVRFALCDYRECQGQFDRIVSVGMFEHVGVPHYPGFFRTIRSLLTPDGVALLHSIGRAEGPETSNPWLRKYIFPGGYSPALSEVIPQVERAGLWLTDMEILRLHYAQTLRHWRRRFMANRDKAAALYDERFCRMWEFYLVGCECAFRHQGHMVFQMQLAREVDSVPLTRDYLYVGEGAEQRRIQAA
ncbi:MULTISPECIES: cyclopropane-fatty-acyl-phospholipid synthase family protein [unclassified Azospirillum]|uniref:SAM-dependent methyltransferase n=1 Tax=unclassified Azospirillum TaxID=2630922 RepID=UPI000B75F6A1|nr:MULTISPECIES: cyclopropane-fatty-acyl-phospholipid synthase family protein [unclassified Azospirillum]SNR93509.1 cyclopropane-fatty-acyl-phospholipid synthase [Azospirillum sp. RU38E]SNS09470.1 cyclopropane-fatty-acyl-phospholipid synthase [Azospirillum sp. RU37A]